jgi:hypothetical protein
MKLKSLAAAAALSIAACAPASFANAGVYADDLTKCLVKSANQKDQTELTVWIFSAMSAHPAVRPLANVSDAQRDQATKRVAALFGRLMTIDCRSETVSALKYEGTSSIETAFGLLGKIAVSGLMGDPEVEKGMASLGTYADTPELRAVLKEAGVETKDGAK